MIKYNLKCHNNHEFESWFSDSNEFEKLDKKKLLECIYCSSKKISKSIMAPMVSVVKEKNNNIKNLKKLLSQEKDKLLNLRNYIEKKKTLNMLEKILVEKLEKFIMIKIIIKQFMAPLLKKKEKS